jgi:hypothetical protein
MLLGMAVGMQATTGWLSPAHAQGKADTILTVTRKSAVAGVTEFSRESLEGIGPGKLLTKTPWDHSPVEFEGVFLSEFASRIGATNRDMKLTALNDYSIMLPASDAKYNPLLATRRSGQPLQVRDKGPVFVVYPFDQHPELANETIYARCIWQVCRVDVL